MNAEKGQTIQKQVKLPLRVAFEVVAQGIKIRFGRSVITIMGVVLGIAFLMSILTSQVLKKGVLEEDRLRAEAKRMYNFLVADTGPVYQKNVAILVRDKIDPVELRFFRLIEQKGAAEMLVAGPGEFPFREFSIAEKTDIGTLSNHKTLIVVPGPDEKISLPETGQEHILAFTRKTDYSAEGNSTLLRKEMTQEEKDRIEAEKRTAAFRDLWIIIISLLVTVIGIANAMLMSVTERFREIGTMKCLGALSGFVRIMFLIESGFMGTVGGIAGILVGFGFSFIAYMITYGPGLILTALGQGALLLAGYALISFATGIILSICAAIYPANFASRMLPADALRTNI